MPPTTDASVSLPPARPSGRLLAALAAAVLVVAGAGYAWTGSPRLALNPPEPPAAAAVAGAEQIAAMVDGLAARLKQNPEDAEGWAMLGRSYGVLGRHPEAVAAYREALRRRPDDPRLLTDTAAALAAQAGQTMTPEAGALVERALQLAPDDLRALSLAGSAAFEREDWAAAVTHWQRLLERAPPDKDFTPQLQSAIAEARRRGGLAAPAAAAAAAPGPAAGPSAAAAIEGRVTLAPALQGQAAPGDTVFVFARPADGSRAPVAIVRARVADLPLAFRLDDASAMSPQRLLSAQAAVVVGARISRSGDAMPQAGDLEAAVVDAKPGTRGLELRIDRRIER